MDVFSEPRACLTGWGIWPHAPEGLDAEASSKKAPGRPSTPAVGDDGLLSRRLWVPVLLLPLTCWAAREVTLSLSVRSPHVPVWM